MTENTLDTRSLHPNPLLEAADFLLQASVSFLTLISAPSSLHSEERIYDSCFLARRKESAPKRDPDQILHRIFQKSLAFKVR